MKRILLIFLLLLLPLAAWGNNRTITSDSLPYTCTLNGSNYSETLFVDGTIISSSTAITFGSCDNIVLYMVAGDTIKHFLDSATVSSTNRDNPTGGIYFSSGSSYIKIVGGVIMTNPTVSNFSHVTNIKIGDTHDVEFYGTKILVSSGYNAHNVCFMGSCYNILFDSCHFQDKVTKFDRRDYYDGISVKNCSGDLFAYGGDYCYQFYDCTWDSCYGGCISVWSTNETQKPVIVRKNNINVDTYNSAYTYYDPDEMHGTTNCGGIGLTGITGGSYIDSNTVTAGDEHNGTDIGIILQHCYGDEGNPVVVAYNNVSIHFGIDSHYGHLNSKALKMRWGNKHVWVHHNTFSSYAASTDSAYSDNTICFDWATWGVDGSQPCTSNVVEYNTFNAIGKDSLATGDVSALRLHHDASDGDFVGAGNKFSNNIIHSTNYAFDWGCYDGDGEEMFLDSNTIYLDSTWDNIDRYVHYFHACANGSYNNVILDCEYPQGDIDTSIYGYSGVYSIFLKRTLNIRVLDGNGYNADGIIVKAIDNYDHVQWTDTTGTNGIASGIATYWYESSGADSMAYNDFTIVGFNSDTSDADTITMTVAHDNYTDTLQLAKFYGTGPMPTTFYVFWDHSSVGDGTMNENGDSTLYYNFKREFIRIMADSGFTCYFVDYRHNSSNPYGGARTSKRDMTPDGSDDDLGYGRNVNGLCIDWGTITWNMYFSYFNDFWEQARNNSTHFGKLTLGDTLWDTTAEPDTVIEIWPGMFADNPDSVGFIWIVKSSYFPYGYTPQMSDSLHLVYRGEINEFSDSVNAHPRMIGVVGLGGSLALGGPGAPNSTSRANTMELSNYVLDTLVTLYDNVKALSFYDWIVNKNAGSAYYLYTDSAYSYGGDGDHPGPFGYKVLHDSMLYVWLPELITDLKAYYDTTTQEEEPPPDSTISTSITCTDTTYNSIRIECSFTLENCTVDSSIFYCDAISTKIPSPTNPDDVNFGGLNSEESYECYVISYSTCGIDYSDTLSITTEAESEGFDNSGWTLLHSLIFDDTTYSMSDGDGVGDNSWLTVQLYGNASIEAESCYTQLTTPNYTDMALLHSTDTLPDEYLIRTKWGYINYDTSNYEAADSDAYSISADYVENGIYLLIISDSILANENCNESIWHHRRKINIDIDNSPNANHPIYFVYFDTAQLGGMDAIRSWDGAVWDSSEWNWNVGYTYAESTYYWIELKKENDEWIIKFYDENENLLVECASVPIELCTQYEKSDYLYMGEPHNDDYEGDARIMEVNLYIPTEEGVSNKYIGILK